MVYDHMVWLNQPQAVISKGIDEAYLDARDRVFASQAKAQISEKPSIGQFRGRMLHHPKATLAGCQWGVEQGCE